MKCQAGALARAVLARRHAYFKIILISNTVFKVMLVEISMLMAIFLTLIGSVKKQSF